MGAGYRGERDEHGVDGEICGACYGEERVGGGCVSGSRRNCEYCERGGVDGWDANAALPD